MMPDASECEAIASGMLHDPDFDMEKFFGASFSSVIETLVADGLISHWDKYKDLKIVKKHYSEASANTKVVSRRFYKAGYEIRKVEVRLDADIEDTTVTLKRAYTPRGEYVGEPRMARLLIVKMGILPEYARRGSKICTVGYCPRDGKWYGWSHRAIFGFKVGDMIFEENFGNDRTRFSRHGRYPIKTISDARRSAVAFARSVS
jgi:hypothetical protein